MLFAENIRFDFLQEMEAAMTAEVRKTHYIDITNVPKRITLSDANARRSEKIFEEVCRGLNERNKNLIFRAVGESGTRSGYSG